MACTRGLRVACRLLPAVLFANSAPAQQSSTAARVASVTAATGPITVDGVLDESAWQLAPKIGDLIQREPRNGEVHLPEQHLESSHAAD